MTILYSIYPCCQEAKFPFMFGISTWTNMHTSNGVRLPTWNLNFQYWYFTSIVSIENQFYNLIPCGHQGKIIFSKQTSDNYVNTKEIFYVYLFFLCKIGINLFFENWLKYFLLSIFFTKWTCTDNGALVKFWFHSVI